MELGAEGQKADVQGGVVCFLGVLIVVFGVFIVDVVGRSCRVEGCSCVGAVFVVAFVCAILRPVHTPLVRSRRLRRDE